MPRDVSKLTVYQMSMDLAVEVIQFSSKIKPFKIAEQIAASALSIPSNLAEGSSYDGEKDYLRFIAYSLGSASELSTQLTILNRIYPEKTELKEWIEKANRIQKMLASLRRSLASRQ